MASPSSCSSSACKFSAVSCRKKLSRPFSRVAREKAGPERPVGVHALACLSKLKLELQLLQRQLAEPIFRIQPALRHIAQRLYELFR